MTGATYACGCSIYVYRLDGHETVDVHHCSKHIRFYSQDKTIRQMASEIRAVAKPHG